MMRGSLWLALLFAVACGGSEERHFPDAHQGDLHDAGAGSGSGSDSMAALDAHPHDNKLELLVAGLSAVVVLGPIHSTRKRRADG